MRTDYKFGSKNNWRRWLWNRIDERVSKKNDAIILYLAGPQDLDRPIAIEKGFEPDNLIAIEKDKKIIEILRDGKKLCISGELSETLATWPFNISVSVVVADLCCGLENRLIGQLRDVILFHPAFVDAVFCFNFLRGRDPSSNFIRSIVQDSIKNAGYSNRVVKHRGILFLTMVVSKFSILAENRGWSPSEIIDFVTWYERFASPSFNTYKSAPQFFDSTVFKNSFVEAGIAGKLSFAIDNGLKANPYEFRQELLDTLTSVDWGKGHQQRKKTGAILAHRTMKERA